MSASSVQKEMLEKRRRILNPEEKQTNEDQNSDSNLSKSTSPTDSDVPQELQRAP